MPDVILAGCRTTPLAGYLAALGVLRAVTRTLDPDAAGFWQAQRFVLRSRLADVDELADALQQHFEPEAIVSPWSEGAGLREKPSNRSAATAVEWLRKSSEPRLRTLRDAVLAGDRVIDRGLANGWGGTGSNLWDKKFKPELLRLCRNELPDGALAWLDTAATLGQGADPSYSRLLGTGGNFGRQDLSATYLSRVRHVFEDRRSTPWLAAVLGGAETVPYLRDAVGQFDPGRAGGIQSSPMEKADDNGFVNPWAFLLTVEGALLFASAVVRRHGAEYADAALPFQVRGATSGHDSAAAGEPAPGELWAPEWQTPIRIPGLEQLLGEGRARWCNHPARSGLDFARAVANLGVDRGIDAFERYVFVDRLGQNPLAVPAGRVRVRHRPGVGLLATIDPWLEAVGRRTSRAVAARVRAVEQALFRQAASGSSAALADVFAAIGDCHDAVARSGNSQQGAWPLVLRHGTGLFDELAPALGEDAELRVALALATARDEPTRDAPHTKTMHGLRPLLSPVIVGHRSAPTWSNRAVPASLGAGLPRALAAAARLRSQPRPADAPADGEAQPAIRGARIAYQHGTSLRSGDVADFLGGKLDEQRLTALLSGLLTVDWHGLPDVRLPGQIEHDPVLDLLLPFAGVDALTYPLPDGDRAALLLRPGRSWPALLSAERGGEVLADAVRRLKLGGVAHVITPRQRLPAGDRLAALLLFRTSPGDRLSMLRRIADLPQARKTMEEITP